MNHYYTNYQKNNFRHTTPLQWENYGLQSFKNLMYFLGYPQEDTLDAWKDLVVYQEFEPGTILQEQDAACDNFYFIIKGSVKIGSIKSEQYTTFALFNEGNIASSLFDFFENTPSQYAIETCSRTRCLVFSKATYKAITAVMDLRGLEIVLNNINQNFLKYLMWFQGYQCLDAEGKIKSLYDKYPEIIQSFKDDHVASFLGMRRETYCKLKKKVF